MNRSSWRVRGGSIDLSAGVLVGVLNVTPDSFSDGGMHMDPEEAVAFGLAMVDEGASVVDVGGESTRPGAEPVPADVEASRAVPVIAGLAAAGVVTSIDTSKPEVAMAAISAGAQIVNDVTGFSSEAMIEVAADTGIGVVAMHMKGRPKTMQDAPAYDDVVREVVEFLERRVQALVRADVAEESIVIDPGFGFGKSLEHNMELITRMAEIVAMGPPVMIGTSRKSSLARITGEPDPLKRDGHTAVTTALCYERGVRLFRVHDVAASRDALSIVDAIVASN